MADFYCPSKKLVIQIASNETDSVLVMDNTMIKEDIKTIRIPYNYILKNANEILNEIKRYLNI
jgi:very-short-patch-repair endonuclease